MHAADLFHFSGQQHAWDGKKLIDVTNVSNT